MSNHADIMRLVVQAKESLIEASNLCLEEAKTYPAFAREADSLNSNAKLIDMGINMLQFRIDDAKREHEKKDVDSHLKELEGMLAQSRNSKKMLNAMMVEAGAPAQLEGEDDFEYIKRLMKHSDENVAELFATQPTKDKDKPKQ